MKFRIQFHLAHAAHAGKELSLAPGPTWPQGILDVFKVLDSRNDGEDVPEIIASGRLPNLGELVQTSVLPLTTLGAYNVDLPAPLGYCHWQCQYIRN